MTSRVLLRNLVHSEGERDPDILRMIYKHAKAAKDVDILTSLVGRTDVPDDVMNLLAKDTSARVRVAYINRADLPLEDLKKIISGERRVTVLAAIASSEHVTAQVLELLWETNSHNSALRKAIIEQKKTPAPLRYKAVRAIFQEEVKKAWLGYHLTSVANGHEDIYDLLARNLGNEEEVPLKVANYLQFLVASPKVSMEGLENLYDVYVKRSVELDSVNSYRVSNLSSIVDKFLRLPALPNSVQDHLRALAADAKSPLMQGVRQEIIKNLGARASTSVEEVQGQVHVAMQSTDGAELKATTDYALDRALSPEGKSLIGLLLSNPRLDEDDVVRLLPYSNRALLQVVVQRDDLGRETLVRLLGAHLSILADLALRGYELPEGIGVEVAANYPRDADLSGWMTLLLYRGEKEPGLVDMVPWQYFTEDRYNRKVGAKDLDALEARMVEVLGTNEGRWELFTKLAENFTGTAGELFDTVEMLHQ